MENKLIENLVNETFKSDSETKEWTFYFLEELNCYWEKEKNWFFPKEIFDKYLSEENVINPELKLDGIFEVHKSSKFKVKKNEGDYTLILYIEKADDSDFEEAA